MKLPTFKLEKELWLNGFKYVCGIDEVGRGSWAGPLVAAAVIFPALQNKTHGVKIPQDPGSVLRLRQDPGSKALKIRDSKQLLPHHRLKLNQLICAQCLCYAVSEIGVKTINREGIAKATQRAFRKCLKALKIKPDFILIDAFYIKNIARKNQKAIIKGDQKSATIAAASIIAKVYRDRLMKKLHRTDKRFRFDLHKGYGTKRHQESIRKHGLSPHHRLAFIPKDLLQTNSF